MCRSFAPELQQSYLKHYIGFRLGNQAFNFAVCKPGPTNLRLEIKLPKTDEIDAELERTDLQVLAYRRHFGSYAINLKTSDIETNRDYLFALLKRAYDNRR